LSSGEKVGIGIGAAVMGIAVPGVCVWLLLRQRRKAAARPHKAAALADNMDPTALRYQKFELENEVRRRHELAANPVVFVLGDDKNRVYEMP
jgi:hypothetical protein